MASRLFHLQPWHHHMGTTCHSHHHNTLPTTYRTQNITSTKTNKQRQKLPTFCWFSFFSAILAFSHKNSNFMPLNCLKLAIRLLLKRQYNSCLLSILNSHRLDSQERNFGIWLVRVLAIDNVFI
jgi:hypothetical protein